MKNKIRYDYFNNEMSIKQICNKYHFSVCKFYTYISKNETRSLSKSIKNYRKKNKISLSDETKNKISKALIKAHKEGRHPGWKHINSDKSRRSTPEKIFFKFLNENNFFKKYNISEKLQVGKYFLDFAIIDKKIDVELDGDQHYRKESIEHDKKRDQFLNDNGWVIYRMSWYKLRNNIKNELKIFCDFLESNNIKNRFYDRNEVLIKIKKEYKCECGIKINRKSNHCKKCAYLKQRKIKNRPPYEQLLKEIKKLNYCGVGRKYGVSDNAIRKWKKYYEKQQPYKQKKMMALP